MNNSLTTLRQQHEERDKGHPRANMPQVEKNDTSRCETAIRDKTWRNEKKIPHEINWQLSRENNDVHHDDGYEDKEERFEMVLYDTDTYVLISARAYVRFLDRLNNCFNICLLFLR